MDFATFMQYMTGAQSSGATAMPGPGAAPSVSPVEAIGQQLDIAKAAVPPRPRVGPYRYKPGGQWGAAQVMKANTLQSQYEAALGNPGAAQNDPRRVHELGGWGAMP